MDGHIKIGDFGLVTTMLEESEEQRTPLDSSSSSASFGERHTAQVGTELYMSPEQVSNSTSMLNHIYIIIYFIIAYLFQRKGKPYNYKVDIYSLGLILFELLVPFGTEMERIHTMQSLHRQKFPADFPSSYQNEVSSNWVKVFQFKF